MKKPKKPKLTLNDLFSVAHIYPPYLIQISPISINACWQGRRFKTPEYKAWREEAGWLVKGHLKQMGWVGIEVEFHIKNHLQADVDNMIKPFLDVLTENQIIEDDRRVKWINAEKFKVETKKEEKIIYSIYKE